MKKINLIFMLVALTLSAHAWLPADSVIITRMLSQAPAKATPLYFARCLKGKPYVAHTLEVNDTERLVVNVRELDCTTLVENAVAMTLCVRNDQRTFADFRHWLTLLRYRRGQLDGYPSRLHYFTDWINDNVAMGLVSEVVNDGVPFSGVQTISVNYMSEHPQQYKALKNHPEFVPVIAKQERRLTGQQYRFIPKSIIRSKAVNRQLVRDGDILAITCTKEGLDIAHVGVAVWKEDGLHLLHASSQQKQVIEDPLPLSTYLARHSSFTGIRVIRVQNSIDRVGE